MQQSDPSSAGFSVEEHSSTSGRSRRVVEVASGATVVTLIGGGLVVTGDVAHALTFTATDEASLNQAIADANANAGADTITIAEGTITLTASLTPITEELTVIGAGQSSTVIDGADSFAVFYSTTSSAQLTVQDLTIQNAYGARGPAVYARDSLVLTRVTMSGNRASDGGGAVYVQYYGGDGGGFLTITDSTFSDNIAAAEGGAIMFRAYNGQLQITDSTFAGNYASSTGGAIAAWDRFGDSTMSITNSTFTGNSAYGGGGAIYIDGNDDTISITDSYFSGNRSVNNAGGAMYIATDGTVTVSNTVFADNYGKAYGGAMKVYEPLLLTVSGSDFERNSSNLEGGGAIRVEYADEIRILDSNFVANTTTGGYEGGALLIDGNVVKGTEIANSTFSANTSANNAGAIRSDSSLFVFQSTITGNSAVGQGGAIVQTGGPLALVNVTMTDNSAGSVGGVYAAISDADLTEASGENAVVVINSVISGSTDDGGNQDLVVVTENGVVAVQHSLIGSTPVDLELAGPGNLAGVDPLLGDLGDNGGNTATMEPLEGSPLIDAGLDAGALFETDQRGLARIYGASVDIGAVESQPEPVESTTTTTLAPTTVPTTVPAVVPTTSPASSVPVQGVLPPTGGDARTGLLAVALTGLGALLTLGASRRRRADVD